jgi:hydrogenase-4 component E
MENGLFFAATSATYGMPMVVEFGIALDVMVGMVIWACSFPDPGASTASISGTSN